jgi:Tol biopolymer transport system component
MKLQRDTLLKAFLGVLVFVALGTVIAAGVVVGVDALRSSDSEPSALMPTTTESASVSTGTGEDSVSTADPRHPFAAIRGWIVYGDHEGIYEDEGIWAIDPTHPGGDRPSRIRLSDQSGQPVAWSRDGSKLLIVRPFIKPRGWWADVSLLNANGVVKRVLRMKNLKFASLSPDGLQVVYSTVPLRDGGSPHHHFGIYLADVDGGGARLLKAPHRRWYGSEKTTSPTQLFAATFSPDGSQIAYVDGMGDWGNSIRVMDADGSHVRVLVDWRRGGLQKGSMDNHVYRLAWSPDGSRLAFATDDGIWVVGSDGSGLRMVIRHGHNPTWSPDGSRLAYATWKELGTWSGVRLRIADADGSHVQTLAHIDTEPWSGFAGPGSWNPLEGASSKD